MKRTLISELNGAIDRSVTVQGWVHSIRDQKRMQFLIVRDHTGCAQFTLEKSGDPGLAERVSALTRESAVRLVGRVVENPMVRLGGVEVHLSELRVEGRAASPLPLDLWGGTQAGAEVRLDWRYLDLRRPENRVVFQVQTTVEAAMREAFRSEEFLEIHTPRLMGSPSESGAELFELDYFGKTAYLAQSPQFYKQMAMAAGFDRVFEIGPVFRAEPSFTSRHTAEFTGVDAEFAWIDSHEKIMAFEERWLRYVFEAVRAEHGEEISAHLGLEVDVPEVPFPRIAMAEAIGRLAGEEYAPSSGKGDELDASGERLLGEYVRREYGHAFVFLTDYPASARPFYHMRHEDAPDITRSFDLFWNGLEITTGAQREHRRDRLVRQAREKGLGLEPIRFYLDFFRYGCPPHGGFGLGLARLLMVMLGRDSLRETTFLSRTPNRLHP